MSVSHPWDKLRLCLAHPGRLPALARRDCGDLVSLYDTYVRCTCALDRSSPSVSDERRFIATLVVTRLAPNPREQLSVRCRACHALRLHSRVAPCHRCLRSLPLPCCLQCSRGCQISRGLTATRYPLPSPYPFRRAPRIEASRLRIETMLFRASRSMRGVLAS